MQRDPGGRTLDLEGIDHLGADAGGIGDGHAGVEADDPDVINRGKIGHDLPDPPRRQHQRIAAGQDDFPNLLVVTDIGECVRVALVGERTVLARSNHLAAKTEAAIDRADMNQLEQHTVGIAVHDSGHG